MLHQTRHAPLTIATQSAGEETTYAKLKQSTLRSAPELIATQASEVYLASCQATSTTRSANIAIQYEDMDIMSMYCIA